MSGGIGSAASNVVGQAQPDFKFAEGYTPPPGSTVHAPTSNQGWTTGGEITGVQQPQPPGAMMGAAQGAAAQMPQAGVPVGGKGGGMNQPSQPSRQQFNPIQSNPYMMQAMGRFSGPYSAPRITNNVQRFYAPQVNWSRYGGGSAPPSSQPIMGGTPAPYQNAPYQGQPQPGLPDPTSPWFHPVDLNPGY